MRKKICWVTPDSFVDCDIDIIPSLCKMGFDIHWIVTFSKYDRRYNPSDFEKIQKENANLKVECLMNNHRARYPHTMLFYLKIKKIIKRLRPDLIYFNSVPVNPYMLPLYLWLPKDKTIVTAHDGSIKSIMRLAKLTEWMFRKCYTTKKYVQMFSPSQARLFQSNFPGPVVYVIPLAPKNYGIPTVSKRTDCISFFSFGTMHAEKNIGLLIDAAEELYEEGVRGFKVSINGKWCENYNVYERIKTKDIFELRLELIPNEAIANIFGYNYYAVLPYKAMSQSGAIKVAYNYYNPVIVSDLEGFTDEVVDGVDGFIFKSNSLDSLKQIMKECVEGGTKLYSELSERFKYHVDETYSLVAIVNQYAKMFNEVIYNK